MKYMYMHDIYVRRDVCIRKCDDNNKKRIAQGCKRKNISTCVLIYAHMVPWIKQSWLIFIAFLLINKEYIHVTYIYH